MLQAPDLTKAKKIHDFKSKGSLGPSDSQLIRDILVDGNPIPWLPYTPSTITATDDVDDTLASLGIASADSEADITDIVSSYLTAPDAATKMVGPVVPVVPNILISLCTTRGGVMDLNFLDSPVVIPHNPAVDPRNAPTRFDFSGSRRTVRSNATGKQFVLGLPFQKVKRPACMYGQNHPSRVGGKSHEGKDKRIILNGRYPVPSRLLGCA